MKLLFIVDNVRVYYKKGSIFIGGKLAKELLPAYIENECIGVIDTNTWDLITPRTVPNYGFDTRLRDDIILSKDTPFKFNKPYESKKFTKISRGVKGGLIKVDPSEV